LRRARDAALVTLPYLIASAVDHSGVGRRVHRRFTESEELVDTFQSVGARGVNNLASKLLLSLFPPDAPFFQLEVNPTVLAQLQQGGGEEFRSEILTELRRRERLITREVETSASRPVLYNALRHLIVAGNVVLHWPDELGRRPRLHTIEEFVCERDGEGDLIQCIILEEVHPDRLPPGVTASQTSEDESVQLLTWIVRSGDGEEGEGEYTVTQEVEDGQRVSAPARRYIAKELPWLVLGLNRVPGEHYSRGFVEEHLGDLQTLEGLTQAIVEMTAAAARMIGLVDPAGNTDPEDLNNALNGDYVPGREQDVAFLGLQKAQDLRVAQELAQRLALDLSRSFLTFSPRDSERTTAEEIRTVLTELEGALGGVYSSLTHELQIPLVRLTTLRLEGAGALEPLSEGEVEARIVTGVEALGRSQELTRLQVAVQTMQSIFGPEQTAQVLNLSATTARIFAAAGVDTEALIKTEEEIQQAQQLAQLQQLVERLGPNFINQVGESLRGGGVPPQAAPSLSQPGGPTGGNGAAP